MEHKQLLIDPNTWQLLQQDGFHSQGVKKWQFVLNEENQMSDETPGEESDWFLPSLFRHLEFLQLSIRLDKLPAIRKVNRVNRIWHFAMWIPPPPPQKKEFVKSSCRML